MGCYRVEPGAIVLDVRLTPKASRDAIDKVVSLAEVREVVRIRVRAAPEDGEANKALIALLAKVFRVPKSTIELVSGATSRLKQVRIPGNPIELVEIISGWQAAGELEG